MAKASPDLLGDIASPKGQGIGGHQSARSDTDEWLTPPALLQALGSFDLDPCAPVRRPWEIAGRHYTIRDNGLAQPWEGRVFCNPPYGQETDRWMARMADHRNGIALIFARIETRTWLEHVWPKADAILFLAGRLTFYTVYGKPAQYNGGAPSALIAYGSHNVETLHNCGVAGAFVTKVAMLGR